MGGVLVINKEKALKNQGLEFREDIVCGGGTVGTLFNHQIGYLGCYYGNILLFYVSAMASIVGLCYLCKCMPTNNYIIYFGSNTMTVLVMHKFAVTFLLVWPVIKNYITYAHPVICAVSSVLIMGLYYFVGWVLLHNKMCFQILLGK